MRSIKEDCFTFRVCIKNLWVAKETFIVEES